MPTRGGADGRWDRGRMTLAAGAVALAVGLAAIGYGGGWFAASGSVPVAAPLPAGRVSTAPTVPESTTAGPAGTLTVLGAGDILVHPEIWQQARADGGGRFDFGPLFAGVRRTVSAADLAICHLETPLAEPGGPFSGFPTFSAPPQILDGITSAGFDACSTASNHSLDHGEAGITRTIAALDRAGLGHSGTYPDARAAARPTIYRVRGVKVAHLSYTAHFNGIRPPAGRQWLANRLDPRRIRTAADRARRAGAEIVLLSLHWGTEYRHEPDAQQLSAVHDILADDNIDAILGHHAHVVQPFERIDGTWVAYGMGNQLARHADPIDANREGVMARLTFSRTDNRRWRVTRIEALPTWVQLTPTIRLLDLTAALADPALPATRRRTYQAAFRRVSNHVLSRNAHKSGLRIPPPN